MRYKVLAKRPIATGPLQWNLTFGEMLDQVHFSCTRLCWKVTKHDVLDLLIKHDVLDLLVNCVSLRLFEWPS